MRTYRLPETKNLTLEELDTVFNVGNREHFRYYKDKLPWYAQKYILRQDPPPMEPLFQFHDEVAVSSSVERGGVGASERKGYADVEKGDVVQEEVGTGRV
jgi:hypothetical protein